MCMGDFIHKLDGTSFVCCDKMICDREVGDPVVFDLRACPQLADRECEACALVLVDVLLIWTHYIYLSK